MGTIGAYPNAADPFAQGVPAALADRKGSHWKASPDKVVTTVRKASLPRGCNLDELGELVDYLVQR